MNNSLRATLDSARSAKIRTSTLVAVAGVAVVVILVTVGLGLSSSVGDLSKQVTKLNDRIARLEQQGAVAMRSTGPADEVRDRQGPVEKRTVAAQETLHGEELQRLTDVVRASGLDRAGLSPEMLKDLAQKYDFQKRVPIIQEQLKKRNAELHKADEVRYGSRVTALYEQAKGQLAGPPGSPGAGEADPQSDAALQTLMEQYPQANSTGMAIAQRALQSAMQGKTSEVEAYYNSLSQNGAFASVVTDRGVEAMPALQLYLATNYLQQNRVSDAQALLQYVEQNYSQSAIPIPGSGGQPNWQPVATITQGIRQQIQSGGKGPPPPQPPSK